MNTDLRPFPGALARALGLALLTALLAACDAGGRAPGAAVPPDEPQSVGQPMPDTVAGRVGADADADGTLADTETGAGGSVVTLRQDGNADGRCDAADPELATTEAAADGGYRFEAVGPGSYCVEARGPAGSGTFGPFTLLAGSGQRADVLVR
jgi:hypothetical protein